MTRPSLLAISTPLELPSGVVDQLNDRQYHEDDMIAVCGSALHAAGFKAVPGKVLCTNNSTRAASVLPPMPYSARNGDMVEHMLDEALNESDLHPAIKTIQLFLPLQVTTEDGIEHWVIEEINCVKQTDGEFKITSLILDSANILPEAFKGTQQQSGGNDCGPICGWFVKQRAVGNGQADDASVLRDIGSEQKFRAGVKGLRARQIEDLYRFPISTPQHLLEAGEELPAAADLVYRSCDGLPPEETFAISESEYLQANPCGENSIYTLKREAEGVKLTFLAPNIARHFGEQSGPGQFNIHAMASGTVEAVYNGGQKIVIKGEDGSTYTYDGMVKGAIPAARTLLVNQQIVAGDVIKAGDPIGQVWREKDGFIFNGRKPEVLLHVTDASGEEVDLMEEFALLGHDETHLPYRLQAAETISREIQKQEAQINEASRTLGQTTTPESIVLPKTERQLMFEAGLHLLGNASSAIAPSIGRIAPAPTPATQDQPPDAAKSMQVFTPPTLPTIRSNQTMPTATAQTFAGSAGITKAPPVPAVLASTASKGLIGRFFDGVATVADTAANLVLRPFTLPSAAAKEVVQVTPPGARQLETFAVFTRFNYFSGIRPFTLPSAAAKEVAQVTTPPPPAKLRAKKLRQLKTSEVVTRVNYFGNGFVQEFSTATPGIIGVNMMTDYNPEDPYAPQEITYVDSLTGNAKPVTDLSGNPLGTNQWVLNGRYLLSKSGNDLNIGPVGYRNTDGSQLVTCVARNYFTSPQNALNTGITLGQQVPASPSYHAAQSLTFGATRTKVSTNCIASADARNIALSLTASGSSLYLSSIASNGVEIDYFGVDAYDAGTTPSFYRRGSTNYVVYQKNGVTFNRQISASNEPTGGINRNDPVGATLVSGDAILANGVKFSANSVSQPVTIAQTSHTICALLGSGPVTAPTADGAEVYFQTNVLTRVVVTPNPGKTLIISGDICANLLEGGAGCDTYSGVDSSRLAPYDPITGSQIENTPGSRISGTSAIGTQTYGGIVTDNGQQVFNPAIVSGNGAIFAFDNAQIYYDNGPSFSPAPVAPSVSSSISSSRSVSKTGTHSRTSSRSTTNSVSNTGTPSNTRSGTRSSDPSQSQSSSVSAAESHSSSKSGSATKSLTGSSTVSASHTSTASETSTISETASPSESDSASGTRTRTPSKSRSDTKTTSPTQTTEPTSSPSSSQGSPDSSSNSPLQTQTPAESGTGDTAKSSTSSPTSSPSPTSSQTSAASESATKSDSATQSSSKSATPPSAPASTTSTRSEAAKASASKSSSPLVNTEPIRTASRTKTTSQPTSTSREEPKSSNTTKNAIIAGSVVGGFAIIALAIAAWRKKRNKDRQNQVIIPEHLASGSPDPRSPDPRSPDPRSPGVTSPTGVLVVDSAIGTTQQTPGGIPGSGPIDPTAGASAAGHGEQGSSGDAMQVPEPPNQGNGRTTRRQKGRGAVTPGAVQVGTAPSPDPSAPQSASSQVGFTPAAGFKHTGGR